MIDLPESTTPGGCGLPQHELPRTSVEAWVNLVRAAVAMAQQLERQAAHQKEQVDLIQAAASAARKGDQAKADTLRMKHTMNCKVFDFGQLSPALIKAAKPFYNSKVVPHG